MSSLISNPALWNETSPVWLVVAFAAGICVFFRHELSPLQTGWAIAAILFLLVAFVSPIGVLADGYLFSAHMVQHLLLLLVIPLCVLKSLPSGPVERFLSASGRSWPRRLLREPMAGWSLGIGMMWFWHVPALCNAATQNEALGFVRSCCFLLAGIAFWWTVYGPIRRDHLPAPTAIVYLFSACLGCTLLGIYITFTTISVCPAFANPVDRIGITNLLYDAGLTPGVDQQLGGLLMWVPPCSLYVGAIIGLLCRWYAAPSDSDVKTGRDPSIAEAPSC